MSSQDVESFFERYRSDAHFRLSVIDELTQSVAKTGGFGSSRSFVLMTRPGKLKFDEVLWLYEQVRAASRRLEPEWRKEFVQAFPQVAERLPASDRNELMLFNGHNLFDAIVRFRDQHKVRKALEEIHAAGIRLSDFNRISQMSMREKAVIFCAAGFPAEKSLGWLEVARLVGDPEIERLLQEAGAK